VTTAIIGTGGIGSAIAHRLGKGGERLRLSSADAKSAKALAGEIGLGAAVALDNRDALQGADNVILALRFDVLEGVLKEIAGSLTDKLVVVPSNPVSLDAHGNLVRVLPRGQASGEVVAGWVTPDAHLAMAFGSMSADLLESSGNRSPERAVLFYVAADDRASERVERLIQSAGFEPMNVGGLMESSRIEVGGDLHDLVIGPAMARSLIVGDVE
jgi:predicted dinucleotide-binding enzyme